MNETPLPLAVDRLRRLTLEARTHPRGLGHLSAASGLVCAHGQAYVIGDDEHHLAVYRQRTAPGRLHRLLEGDLPPSKAARKRRKPDFETLLLWPGASLVALGSGSLPQRDRAAIVTLDAAGQCCGAGHTIDLRPLYEPMRERLGPINIEGALVVGEQLLLLNRGHASGAGNVVVHYRLRDVVDLFEARRRSVDMQSVQPFELGAIDGVPLGFTDGAVLPDGGWVFSAVAEDSRDSVADGACRGAALGVVGSDGCLRSLRRLASSDKIEGIDAQRRAEGTVLFMVTDADDPHEASWLLSARL